MSQNQDYVEAAKVSEISQGHMKHIEINGKEIVIANLDGKFYAFADRCGHMNARLSRGNINQNVVTCPFHHAKFDITSGKKKAEPVLEIPPGMEPYLPLGKNIWELWLKRCHSLKHTTKRPMRLK